MSSNWKPPQPIPGLAARFCHSMAFNCQDIPMTQSHFGEGSIGQLIPRLIRGPRVANVGNFGFLPTTPAGPRCLEALSVSLATPCPGAVFLSHRIGPGRDAYHLTRNHDVGPISRISTVPDHLVPGILRGGKTAPWNCCLAYKSWIP